MTLDNLLQGLYTLIAIIAGFGVAGFAVCVIISIFNVLRNAFREHDDDDQ